MLLVSHVDDIREMSPNVFPRNDTTQRKCRRFTRVC